MMPETAVNSRIQKCPTHFLFNCFDPEKVVAGITNRRSFPEACFQSFGVSKRPLVALGQIHSDRIFWVSGKPAALIPEHDAVITQEKDILLTVQTADCAPVFFFDPRNSTIALAHIGWRGAEKGLAGKVVRELRVQGGADPGELQAAIGPAIRDCCYEFDPEGEPKFRSFMKEKKGRACFDLVGYVIRELTDAGIRREAIFDSRLCTFCQPEDFFSYRREREKAGRMVSFIMLKAEKEDGTIDASQ